MKVAVVSDTHGCLSMLDRCIKLAGQVDVWCHLGDLTSDAEALMSRTNAKVYAVRGNCDYFGGSAQRYESEAVVELGGARILMMHGLRTESARIRMTKLHTGRRNCIAPCCCSDTRIFQS